jgi:hypothetical protein
MTETNDLFNALGLVVARRVASGRYLTADIGPVSGWRYFATFRSRSGFWFGVRKADGNALSESERDLFLQEGFSLTNKQLEAIREVGADLEQAQRQSRMVMYELREILAKYLEASDYSDRNARSALLKLSWPEFIEEIKEDPVHQFEVRLKFLRYIRSLFSRGKDFCDFSVSEWKAVAGIVHPDAVGSSGLEADQMGWFGSMQGAGTFTSLVVNRDGMLAQAVDMIPLTGPVSESDYDRFRNAFSRAFEGSVRQGRYSTATRLLAMKRPDAFICVNSGNLRGLSETFGFSRTTLDLGNYWNRVVEPLRNAAWYNSQRPKGDDAEAWDFRAALVDAVVYDAE